ncbi:MAG: hypothetical protein HY028_00140 [Gammaproteobacteria bacterium]|nr:hypothetical protein [Gammaproteobacteria bacterium]
MNKTILLVDDEENITASLVRLLHQDGYRVLTANSAAAALALLANNKGSSEKYIANRQGAKAAKKRA